MLVDAAKQGDVEIPVFCYEPKLGEPVGACRMCLVEIEGMPKLQTACSTPVRDGMVVYTQTDRVQGGPERGGRVPARQPPARLPGLRQGRRVPAAGHRDGLGPGQEPLHRSQAPLPEAARALAAGGDRPRALHPLLPLRPLQPGGGRGRAAAAARARRQDLRRHLRRAALHRALPRQHHRALPGRGADLLHLPLPRAALGHRGRGLGLHALPEPVQRQASRSATSACCGCSPATTPRSTTAGSATRAASPSRCSTRADRITRPMVRAGDGSLSPICWDEAVSAGRQRAAATPATKRGRAGRRRDLQRGGLAGPADPARAAAPRTSTARPSPVDAGLLGELSRPELGSRIADLDHADAILVVGVDPLHEMPILDLRIRKAVRRGQRQADGRLRAAHRARRRRGRGGPLRAGRRRRLRRRPGRGARRRGLRRRRALREGGRRRSPRRCATPPTR